MKLLLSMIKNDCIHTKLAMSHLYSVVAEAPCDTDVMEFEADDSLLYMYREILRGKYHIVYFHCNMMNEEKTSQLLEMVKKAVPTCITVIGGLPVSFETKDYMEQHPEADFVFRGEPEQTLYQFLRSLLTYEFDFENIAGLAYRENNQIRVNPFAAPLRFEDLPFPYERAELDESDRVFYESIRGTADHSAYSEYLPGRIRSLPLGRVCTEIRYFLVKNVRSVRFTDKWFNYNTERAYRIWEYLISNDNGVTTFEFDVNGDLLDEETIQLLSTAREGQFRFFVDVESTNAEALAASDRKENIYQLMYNISKLLQYGNIEITTILRAGLPCETPKQFARSFNKVYGLHADCMKIEILRIRKGTRLRKEANQYGYVYSSIAPFEVIANDYMPATELLKIRNIAELVNYYLNDGGFEESIPKIMADTNVKPYAFFAGLERYIDENRLGTKLRKREHLYRILYGYATQLYDEINETLKLQVLMEVIRSDLERNVSSDQLKKFDKKGWEIRV